MELKSDYTDYLYMWTTIWDLLKAQKKLYRNRMKNETEWVMSRFYEGCLSEIAYYTKFMREQKEENSFLNFENLKTAVGKLKKIISVEYNSAIKRNYGETQLILTRYSEGGEKISYLLFTEFSKMEKLLRQNVIPIKLFDLENLK